MSEMMAAADGIRRFIRDLRILEEVLGKVGSLENAASEMKVRVDRLKREEEEFLASRERKGEEIGRRAAAQAAAIERDKEELLRTREALAAAQGALAGIEETISARRIELKGIEDRVAEFRKMFSQGESSEGRTEA